MSGKMVTRSVSEDRGRPRLRPRLRFGLRWLPACCAVALLLTGCGRPDLETRYGSRQPLKGGDTSVNGTSVLAEMLRKAGHRVNSVSRLTPRLSKSADVIVWFPDDFTPPGPDVVQWFENWLTDKEGRTLILVTRDYDAEADYWAKVLPQAANATERAEIKRRQAAAAARFGGLRGTSTPQPEDWHWFKLDRSSTLPRRSVRTLDGDKNWKRGVDPTKVEIELYGRISIKDTGDEVLLQSGNDALVIRRTYPSPFATSLGEGDSQVIVVANGSFLLNVPLVNHEHRKLAGSLMGELPPNQNVYFLEAGGSPTVFDKDPPAPRMVTSTMYFDVQRVQNLLWYLSVLALVVIFSLFAIFGRPREEVRHHPSDFGQHIEALGDLLSQTRDTLYAKTRLTHYQMMVRGEHPPRREGQPHLTIS